jgi:hypothetical protein
LYSTVHSIEGLLLAGFDSCASAALRRLALLFHFEITYKLSTRKLITLQNSIFSLVDPSL